MKIKNVLIKNAVALAPMAGFTDMSMRTICKSFGAGYVVSEMVSSRGLYYNDKKTLELLNFSEEQRPFGIQIFGNEPEIMARACQLISLKKPDIIDINMGCPTPKIVNNGDGSALMKNPALVGDIIKACASATDIPVTVKLRAGWDENNINAVLVAEIAEKNGASAITIHGRTKAQMYRPPVNLEIIKAVKEHVNIPVFGNGDIKSADDAKEMLEFTKCDGIMIGRASLGNPFIFEEISSFLNSESYSYPTDETKIKTALLHLKLIISDKGEKRGVREARGQLIWYLKGMKNSHWAKTELLNATTYDEMVNILNKI